MWVRVPHVFFSFFSGQNMRYHYSRPEFYSSMYGKLYICESHPVYSRCTLFAIEDRGLAIIQQRYDAKTKQTSWDEIDEWLSDALYLNPGFKRYFDEKSGRIDERGLYPTVAIRQIMWALRMKPLPKERWETCFDRRFV